MHALSYYCVSGVQRLAVNPCTVKRLKACVCSECCCMNRLAELVVTVRRRGSDHRFGFSCAFWCELFGGKARDVQVTEPWSLGIRWVVNQIWLEKWGLGGGVGARILGNYQNFMNCLAARDLPPGAVTEPWAIVSNMGGGAASEWRLAEGRVPPGDNDTNNGSWNSVRLAVWTVPPGGSYRFCGFEALGAWRVFYKAFGGALKNFMNCLAARDLPPGAVTEPWVCVYVCGKFEVLGFVEKAGAIVSNMGGGAASEWRLAEGRVPPGDNDTNNGSWNSVRLAVWTVPPGGSYRFCGFEALGAWRVFYKAFGGALKYGWVQLDCPPQLLTDEFGSLGTLRTMFVIGNSTWRCGV
ncbi:hypothetical protein DEO72_LG3g1965 [Vigna unguiculata]|uniref:Uncharacterized protein n=1 Tax=Vigna unguiculata TaxID=3917 RepID=A0A4D6LFJ9_VIGUN|nr:hypothetical protein DEO72_LG3g1965 [Vigna unguiculata]